MKPIEESLAEWQDQHAKSAGKGGTMTLEEINEVYRLQIEANEESGEE